jgi:hypothetical protein
MIRLLKHHEIDKKHWDAIIENSHNRIVYAQSWYLDIVSPGWNALVTDDYTHLMPLPVKYKLCLPYLIQPKFTQQLGIFSGKNIEPSLVRSFIALVRRKYLWYDINLNCSNHCKDLKNVSFQDNYELDVHHEYDILWKNFNQNTQRNIKKSSILEFYIENTVLSSEFIGNYLMYSKIKPDKTGEIQFRKLVDQSIHLNLGKVYLVKDSLHRIVAGAYFLHQFNRIIYMASFTTEKGRDESAMFYLIHQMIKLHANKKLILDFEGSTIPGIADFFRGFGGNCIPYPRVRKFNSENAR